MGLGQVFAGRAFALDQVRDRIQAEAVHSHLQPELHHLPHFFADGGVVVIEIGLVAEETVPVVCLGNRVPGPVGEFGIHENDAHALILGVGVAPDIPIAARDCPATSRFLKPGMLVGGVVQNHFDDHADAALVGGLEKELEVVEIAVAGMDGGVVGDVVAVIAQRRRKERHQPDGVDTQFLQVIELLGQAAKIADAIAVGIEKRADVDLVDDGVLVPELVLRHGQGFSLLQFTSYSKVIDAVFRTHPPPDTKNVGRQALGIEFDIVARTPPDIFRVSQQIVHLVGLPRVEVERTSSGRSTMPACVAFRIQVHDHDDDIQKVVRHFAVRDDLFVVHRMKLQA